MSDGLLPSPPPETAQEAPALALAGDELLRDAQVLKLAKRLQETLQAVTNNPSPARVRAHREARQALREALAPEQAAQAPGERTFRSLVQVQDYLVGLGYRCSRSTIYRHKDEKKLTPGPGGLYGLGTVEAYAREHLRRLDELDTSGEAYAEEKRRLELANLEKQVRIRALKVEELEGRYIPREEAERDLATRARLLKADMLTWTRLYLEELILLVGGDPSRAPEALAMSERQVEDWLHRYAAMGEIRLAAPAQPREDQP